MKVQTKGPEETISLGTRLGRTLASGSTVCLLGDLGSGKTTFVKGIAEALGIPRRDITSASFVIVAEHDSKPPLYHIDLYRLRGEQDLETAGVYDYIEGDGIAVIEWAEKINLDDVEVTTVHINYISDDEREIIIENNEHRNNL